MVASAGETNRDLAAILAILACKLRCVQYYRVLNIISLKLCTFYTVYTVLKF